MMPRAHLYNTVTDENGVIWPWASIRVYAADGVTPFSAPIWVDPGGTAQRPNPFVTAPGIVDFYLEHGARITLGITPVSGVEQLTPPIDVPDNPDSMVYSPSALVIAGTPSGDAVLRHQDGASGWYSPSLGAHNHHGTAPLSVHVGLRDDLSLSALSFEDTTILGVRSHGVPTYRWTYDAITTRYRTYNRLRGALYSTLSDVFTPSTSDDLRDSTSLGLDAVAQGQGVIAAGHGAYAIDDDIAESGQSGIALGARAVSRNGAVSLGYRAAGPLGPEISFDASGRTALGSSIGALETEATALGAVASGDSHSLTVGYARSAPTDGVEIGTLFALPNSLSLPCAQIDIPGALHSLRDVTGGPIGFFGTSAPTRQSGLPLDATPLEPASGIEALDNLCYALRDLGLFAPGVPVGTPAPTHWQDEALNILADYQDSLSAETAWLSCDDPSATTLTGRVNGSVGPVDFLPLLRLGPRSGYHGNRTVTGDYDFGLTNPANYRVAIHSLSVSDEVPTSTNRIGLVRVNNPSWPPSLPPTFDGGRTGTWNSFPLTVPANRYAKAVLTDASGIPVPYRDSLEIAPYAAEVVLLVNNAIVTTAPWRIDGFTLAPTSSPPEGFTIELRTLTSTVLARLHRELPEQPLATLGLMTLAFCQRVDYHYRAREILRALTELQGLDGSLPQAGSRLSDYGWIGVAAATYAQLVGSTEFEGFSYDLVEPLLAHQDVAGTLAVGGIAYTADNVLCYLFLRGSDPDMASSLAAALHEHHLLPHGYFAPSVDVDTGGPDIAADISADLFGALFLQSEGNITAAQKALRPLSGYRTGPQVLVDGSTADGYSLTSYPPGALDPETTACASLIRDSLDQGNDNESLSHWWDAHSRSISESPIDYAVVSWFALLGSGASLS